MSSVKIRGNVHEWPGRYNALGKGGCLRVLLTPIGSGGDVFPFIGLGLELRRRGHEAIVITNAHFEDLVRRSGLEFIEHGTDEQFRKVSEQRDLWHPHRGFRTVMDLVLSQATRLGELIQQQESPGETVVVAPFFAFAARILHEKHGLPLVTVHLQPVLLRSLHQIPILRGTTDYSRLPVALKRLMWWAADRFMLDPVVAGKVNELRAREDLPPIRRIFQDWIHSPLLTIGLFPYWYASPQPDWPPQVRLTGFPLWDGQEVEAVPQDLAAFLDDGPPPVVFTAGTAMLHADRFFTAAVNACHRLNRRGMLLTRFPEQIPTDLPPQVRHFHYAPFSRILPRSAALVHHGGIGTTAAALAAGVPQIIMPMSHDQPDNAARVRRLGVGEVLWPRHFTGRRLARALAAMLESDAVRQQCRALAQRCRQQDALVKSCDLIESIMP
jgi:rhamnosyltransferase subunit B